MEIKTYYKKKTQRLLGIKEKEKKKEGGKKEKQRMLTLIAFPLNTSRNRSCSLGLYNAVIGL